MGLLASNDRITAPRWPPGLGLSQSTARKLLKGWTADSWLEVADPTRRGRAYSLSAIYRQYLGNLSAMAQKSKNNEALDEHNEL